MAADLLLGPIPVASDCLEVINDLHGEHLDLFGSILKDIKERADQRGPHISITDERNQTRKPCSLCYNTAYG